MIIYPTDGYHLTKEQYIKIFEAIKQCHVGYYCISDIEFEDIFTNVNNVDGFGNSHKILTSFLYCDYEKLNLLFENALYDINERWGISVFQDFFGIIFGDSEIIREIKLNYSNADDLKKFNGFLESKGVTNINVKNELLVLLTNSL